MNNPVFTDKNFEVSSSDDYQNYLSKWDFSKNSKEHDLELKNQIPSPQKTFPSSIYQGNNQPTFKANHSYSFHQSLSFETPQKSVLVDFFYEALKSFNIINEFIVKLKSHEPKSFDSSISLLSEDHEFSIDSDNQKNGILHKNIRKSLKKLKALKEKKSFSSTASESVFAENSTPSLSASVESQQDSGRNFYYEMETEKMTFIEHEEVNNHHQSHPPNDIDYWVSEYSPNQEAYQENLKKYKLALALVREKKNTNRKKLDYKIGSKISDFLQEHAIWAAKLFIQSGEFTFSHPTMKYGKLNQFITSLTAEELELYKTHARNFCSKRIREELFESLMSQKNKEDELSAKDLVYHRLIGKHGKSDPIDKIFI